VKNLKSVFVFSVLILASLTLNAQKSSEKKILGTWQFEAPEAPYEYSKGEIIVDRNEDGLNSTLVLGESYKLKATDVKFEKKILSFNVYLEGTLIEIKTTLNREGLTGTASYSEGTVNITAKRKKKE